MTAKDEDILTSQSLKNGTALEKLMQNILVDKRINPSSLLIGDRSAILIAARATGYGKVYKTKVTCPLVARLQRFLLILPTLRPLRAMRRLRRTGVKVTADNTYTVKLPLTTVTAEFRLLNGADELAISKSLQKKRNKTYLDGSFSTQFTRAIVALTQRQIETLFRSLPL